VAAETDFPYLRHLARSEKDRRTLDYIARMREHILREEKAPGAPPKPNYFLLRLGADTLVMQENLAAASVDTYLEIFRDEAHQRHPAFHARENRRIVDLGANEGYYTLKMKRDNPEAQILAIEPYPPAFRLLERMIAANELTGVTALPAAACGQMEGVSTAKHPDTQAGNTAGAGPHNDSDDAADFNSASCFSRRITLESYPHVSSVTSPDLLAFPRPWIKKKRIRRLEVPAAPLPELLRKAGGDWTHPKLPIDLLKIDAEGAELGILSGAEEVLERVSRIVVECHGRELRRRCIDYLIARGFDCVLEEEKRSGDAYFVRT